MIELRRILETYLSTLHQHTFYQSAPDDAPYPYLVYELSNVFDDGEGHQLITLDIDGWDTDHDTTPLDNLMELIKTNLNKVTLTTDNLVVTFYLENIIPNLDDGQYKRRKYIYQARLFERE